MLPLYHPSSAESSTSFTPIKWRSLVHLISSPSSSRRQSIDVAGSHDQLAYETETTRRRRPSAPAVLQDLRRMIPNLRRHHSASILINERSPTEKGKTSRDDTDNLKGAGSELSSVSTDLYNDELLTRSIVVDQGRLLLTNLSRSSGDIREITSFVPNKAEFSSRLQSNKLGAKFKCKRVKAARKLSHQASEDEASINCSTKEIIKSERSHPIVHIFKSKVSSLSATDSYPSDLIQQKELLVDSNLEKKSFSLLYKRKGAIAAEEACSTSIQPPNSYVRSLSGSGLLSSYCKTSGNENLCCHNYYPFSNVHTRSIRNRVFHTVQGKQKNQLIEVENNEHFSQSTITTEPELHDTIVENSFEEEEEEIVLPSLQSDHLRTLLTNEKVQHKDSSEFLADSVTKEINFKSNKETSSLSVKSAPSTVSLAKSSLFKLLPSPKGLTRKIVKPLSPIFIHSTNLQRNIPSSEALNCNLLLDKEELISDDNSNKNLSIVKVGEDESNNLKHSLQGAEIKQQQLEPQTNLQSKKICSSPSAHCGCFLNSGQLDNSDQYCCQSSVVSSSILKDLNSIKRRKSDTDKKRTDNNKFSTRPSLKGNKSRKVNSVKSRASNCSFSLLSSSNSKSKLKSSTLSVYEGDYGACNSNTEEEGNHSELYVRRHTIPDMTVAAYGMVICGTDDIHRRYRGRIEKVKFGIPINEAFSHDIPATLLVLLLKVNKEGPLKKDIWRAPGNQIQVRKLSAIMQQGRLVNISNISVYTAASVIKKFLSKLPGGIFGSDNEKQLFSIVQEQISEEEQRAIFCRVINSLSLPSQHLLVLLFGTFRVINDSAETFGTRMTSDAIGISVAPSLFHTCIHDQRAKLEDVMRFKMASQVITRIIQGFGYTNLFPRECYEFYARITGRTLRVDEEWNFTFQYPSNAFNTPTPSASIKLRKSTSHLSAGSGRACRRESSSTISSMISSLQAACTTITSETGASTTTNEKELLLKAVDVNKILSSPSLDILKDETNKIVPVSASLNLKNYRLPIDQSSFDGSNAPLSMIDDDIYCNNAEELSSDENKRQFCNIKRRPLLYSLSQSQVPSTSYNYCHSNNFSSNNNNTKTNTVPEKQSNSFGQKKVIEQRLETKNDYAKDQENFPLYNRQHFSTAQNQCINGSLTMDDKSSKDSAIKQHQINFPEICTAKTHFIDPSLLRTLKLCTDPSFPNKQWDKFKLSDPSTSAPVITTNVDVGRPNKSTKASANNSIFNKENFSYTAIRDTSNEQKEKLESPVTTVDLQKHNNGLSTKKSFVTSDEELWKKRSYLSLYQNHSTKSSLPFSSSMSAFTSLFESKNEKTLPDRPQLKSQRSAVCFPTSSTQSINRYAFNRTSEGNSSVGYSKLARAESRQIHYPTESLQRRINAYCAAANISKSVNSTNTLLTLNQDGDEAKNDNFKADVFENNEKFASDYYRF